MYPCDKLNDQFVPARSRCPWDFRGIFSPPSEGFFSLTLPTAKLNQQEQMIPDFVPPTEDAGRDL
jgi:hypothetical protein